MNSFNSCLLQHMCAIQFEVANRIAWHDVALRPTNETEREAQYSSCRLRRQRRHLGETSHVVRRYDDQLR